MIVAVQLSLEVLGVRERWKADRAALNLTPVLSAQAHFRETRLNASIKCKVHD